MKRRIVKIKEFLFTGFYTGYFPVAPGTAGTIAGTALYCLLYLIFGSAYLVYINIILVLVMVYPAIKLGDAGEEFFAVKDAQQVVLDEMMGFWITMLFLPFSWKMVIAGLFLFRFLDIVKPWPAGKLQDLKGGLGIMIDDYIAGIYGCIILNCVYYLAPSAGFIHF